jgi:aspartyl protease family protein
MFDRGSIMTTSIVALFASAQIAGHIPLPTEEKSETAYLLANEIAPPARSGSSRFSIDRATDGLFHMTVLINGRPVDMAVDTGATRSVVAPSDARRIGLDRSSGRYGNMQTMNGRVQFLKVQLDELTIGDTKINNLEIALGPQQLNQSVIGLDVLMQSGPILIESDRLVLLGDEERRR